MRVTTKRMRRQRSKRREKAKKFQTAQLNPWNKEQCWSLRREIPWSLHVFTRQDTPHKLRSMSTYSIDFNHVKFPQSGKVSLSFKLCPAWEWVTTTYSFFVVCKYASRQAPWLGKYGQNKTELMNKIWSTVDNNQIAPKFPPKLAFYSLIMKVYIW